MAASHSHSHSHGEDQSSYYLEQLFTIGACGALAAVTLALWQTNMLGKMLHQKFHIWVVLGGMALLLLVALRAVAVWLAVDEGAKKPAAPAHEHGPDCDHGHAHGEGVVAAASQAVQAHSHGHSHSHSHSHGPAPAPPVEAGHDGHDHGWAPWRYVVLLLPVVLYFLVLSNPTFDKEPVTAPAGPLDYIQNFIIIFRSILWEALPFIVLGAVIAGLLEEFLPQHVLVNIIPKNPVFAIMAGGLLGLAFPMCECGIVPIMRRLLRKGLPLSSCIAYLLAGPIVNVVVLLSTIAAFSGMENAYEGGEPAYQMGATHMTLFRAGLGYVIAVVTALVVEWQHRKHGNALLTPLARPDMAGEAAEETSSAGRPLWRRINNVTETALHDFVDITVFLILGALLAATTRLFLTPDQVGELGCQNWLLAIVAMMGLAIVLCLCSEADAFVAASFVTLQPSAKLAFLVLGPMLDFKLYAMYTRIFRPRLILLIYSLVIGQCLVYSMLAHAFWEEFKTSLVSPAPPPSALSDADRSDILNRSVLGTGLLSSLPPGGSHWGTLAGGLGVVGVSGRTDVPELSFLQLESVSRAEETRNFYQGRKVQLVGRFAPGGRTPAVLRYRAANRGAPPSEEYFTLERYKINCCAADATPLDAVVVVDGSATKESLSVAALQGKWVRVTGRLSFYEAEPGVWKVAVRATTSEGEKLDRLVVEVPPDPNPYIY